MSWIPHTASLLAMLILATGAVEAQDAPVLYGEQDGPIPGGELDESGLVKRKSIVIVRKRHDKPEAAGVRLGDTLLLPDLLLTTFYDDNVFATETTTESDLVMVVTPSIKIKPASGSDAYLLDAGVETSRYREWSTENTTDSWLTLKGQREIARSQRLDADLSYRRDHEDRGSPDAESGEKPARFDERAAGVVYSAGWGDHHLKLAADFSQLDFDDVDSSFGIIDYDDRDRTERSAAIRYLYKYAARGAVFVEGEADERDYDQSPDNEGNERNSNGSRIGLGLELFRTDLFGRFMLGRLWRDYPSVDFDDVDETDLAAMVNWRMFDGGRLVFTSRRSIEETTLDNSPGYLLQNNSLRASIELSERRTLYFDLIDSTADYYAIDRVDDYLNLGIGFRYQMLERLSFSTDLHRAQRDSSVDGEDYDINQLFIRIRASI